MFGVSGCFLMHLPSRSSILQYAGEEDNSGKARTQRSPAVAMGTGWKVTTSVGEQISISN